MRWHNKGAWHVSLASMCVVVLVITMVTLHCRWLVDSCTVGKLLPLDKYPFKTSKDNAKPDFDVQVC